MNQITNFLDDSYDTLPWDIIQGDALELARKYDSDLSGKFGVYVVSISEVEMVGLSTKQFFSEGE